MTIKDFINCFIETLELEDSSSINESTEFHNLDEWDSLAVLSTISMVDDEYHVTITNKDLKEVNTLAELFDLVKSKQ